MRWVVVCQVSVLGACAAHDGAEPVKDLHARAWHGAQQACQRCARPSCSCEGLHRKLQGRERDAWKRLGGRSGVRMHSRMYMCHCQLVTKTRVGLTVVRNLCTCTRHYGWLQQ
jgi:hypothetical protein